MNYIRIFQTEGTVSRDFWSPELEFLKSLWGLGTEEEKVYHTGQPGYIGLWNSFLGIDSGVPYMFKNTGSGVLLGQKE